MRVVTITEAGGPEVLRVVERPVPEPAAGEIRVRVRASSLNRADLLQRRGRYPAPPGSPADVPGLEYAGEVEALGEGSERWRVGDRVMGIVGGGGHAEALCVREDEAIPVPATLTWEGAAATPEVFITAYDALVRLAGLQAGERVLIHAVGSGVGTAALQLANALGASCLGSSRTAGKLRRAESLGLTHPLDGTGNWLAGVQAVTEEEGVDVVLDLVGGSYIDGDLRAIAQRGRVVVIGTVAGRRTDLDLGLLLRKRATLIGTVLRSRSSEEKAELAREFGTAVLPLLASGRIRPVVDSVYPFDEIAEAHRALEKNESFGKLVLRW